MSSPSRYTSAFAARIESRWQRFWADNRVFHAGRDDEKPKFYLLDQFPGPSGALHVGHPLGYVASDVYGRYKRMRGFNVLHALGFDAFGLPAEQYAVQTGQHPAVTTEENSRTIRRQLDRLGMAYDPRRGVSTTDPSFYRWTQWIFLQLYNSWYDEERDRARPIDELPPGLSRAEVDARRLAYLSEEEVNWCPGLGTVLANEEVTADGRSERGNYPVFRRKLRQWMLRITAYSRRLLTDLETLDWPESLKAQQRHWIPQLRDWLFSRQRYWGEPFPIVYDERGPIALPESMLPVLLPETADFSPTTYDPEDENSEPRAPLARLDKWVEVTLDLGDGPRTYRRETNTMPQWAGSCWYELRYLDPDNEREFCAPENERYWMPVDLYIGGGEHAVLHLLYARFWHKVLYDLGHVSTPEPFRRFFVNGYIQAYSYVDERGIHVPADQVEERDGGFFYEGRPVRRQLGKMGKSLRNMVTPDEICEEYGADTFRLAIMASGPVGASRPWDTQGIAGSFRLLRRIWRLAYDERTGEFRVTETRTDDATRKLLHRTIDVVGRDMEELAFNTAIARLTELVNHLTGLDETPREALEPLVLMLAPFAPHLAEELWSRLGHTESLAYEPYPVADEDWLTADTVT
ncbi:MAG TPA: class I tRNA ligase family protein, partial [Actinopolymorphaceae bacterium]